MLVIVNASIKTEQSNSQPSVTHIRTHLSLVSHETKTCIIDKNVQLFMPTRYWAGQPANILHVMKNLLCIFQCYDFQFGFGFLELFYGLSAHSVREQYFGSLFSQL